MFTMPCSSRLRPVWIALGVVALAGMLSSCSSQPELTAEQVVQQLAAQVPTATLTTVFNAETDPNKLLGRPGGYTSKAQFADSRVKSDLVSADGLDRGGSVEVYPDEGGATKRREYLESIRQATPVLGSEYDYQRGPILVRVSRELTPDQAGEYNVALDNIASGKAPAPAPPPPAPPAPPAVQVPPALPGTVSVASVHDAATVVLTDGTRLRQVGISAPNADTCQAKQATSTTDTEVRRGPLTYQLLGQSDVYGNQWAYLHVAGADFGERLASLGWVWAYPDSPAPQAYNQRITNQVEAARATRAGMFGTTCPQTGVPGGAPLAAGASPSNSGYRLEATTTGGKIMVSYGMGGTFASETVQGPWTKSFPEPHDSGFSYNTFSVSSMDFMARRPTTVTCRVLLNGRVVKEQPATGQTAMVNCAGF